MKLEYIDDLTDGGKYPHADPENLIRLYDFDIVQTEKLAQLIFDYLIAFDKKLNLSELGFIETINCQLILQLSETDKGVLKTEQQYAFTCNLTKAGFQSATEIMKAVDSGYNWLCDTSRDNIDLLYSLGGTW